MYECQMKMIIPPGVGLLVAGLASGICFLLIGSLRKGKDEKIEDDSRCGCCLKPFLVGRGVECNDCGARSCRKGCCRWDSIDNAWLCLFCYHKRSYSRRKEKWFRNFGGLPVESETCKDFSTAKSRIYDEGAENVAIHKELELAAGGCKDRDSMETVREFVEKMVEGLVGDVDNTPIDRLYDHPAYDRVFEAYGVLLASALTRLALSLSHWADNKPATDTPTMAHTALRELVERAVDEARKLPSLGATVSNESHDDSNFSEQNYEDLLATAILNKVIEKFQNERVDGNSNVVDRRPTSKITNHENEMGLDEGVEEGGSSLEPVSHEDRSSEESGPRTRHIHVRQDPLSLTIEEQIEEVTTTYTSDEELGCSKTNVLDFRNARRVPFPEFGMDIVDPSQDSSEDSEDDDRDLTHVDRITPIESWEKNWLFQKRKIQTQSEPVAMLVPNPSSDFRALIGDKDAEDTSDLSEFSAQSDDEIEDEEFTEAINTSIPKTNENDNDFSWDDEDSDVKMLPKKQQNSKQFASKEVRPEIDVNGGCESVGRSNNNNDNYETNRIGDEIAAKASKVFSKNYDALEKPIPSNGEITDATLTLPMKNSMFKNISDFVVVTEVQRLNDNCNAIDDTNDEEETKKEPSKTEDVSEISELGSDDKTEMRINDAKTEVFPSNVETNRHSRSCELNEGPKINSRDVDNDDNPEVGGSDSFDGVEHESLKKSLEEIIQSNGNADTIHDEEIIANFTSNEDAEGKCQALAKARADSASEKPSSEIEVNVNIGLAAPPRPGTIAEREHKKWENAAPIENNPYSEENIQKRLLERQYARRSSDVSGSSNKLQTCPSPPLQIVLGAGRPDFRRFGRDYYINEAKFPQGQSIEDNGFFTATSRPDSSLSQHSLSTGSDYEQQERCRSVETDSNCSTSSESKTNHVADSHRNNVESPHLRESLIIDKDRNATSEMQIRDSRDDETLMLKNASGDGTWTNRNSIDEMFENDRKNTKNEINAKLNNRGNFVEMEKPIKRIDLRAYGFENEFRAIDREKSVRSKRVVNKLDLTSFGYDSGLRRTQSNNNIDRPNDLRRNVRHRVEKSNLVQQSGRFSADTSLESEEGSENGILTNGVEAFVEDRRLNRRKFGGITAAKSVPNIGDLYSGIGDGDREANDREEDIKDFRNTMKSDERSGSHETLELEKNVNNFVGRIMKQNRNGLEKKLPMPSVRKLAQAFDKTEPTNSVPARTALKCSNVTTKGRPTTPEIHIVDSPRQMHSLTARSLSKEFREGLRQIANQKAPPTRPNFIHEQNRSTETPSSESSIVNGDDASVIAPGKLKNDIQFWEQLQRKS